MLVIVLGLQPLLASAQGQAQVIRLGEGTTIAMRPTREISSADAKTGDPVTFTVTTPVVVNGVTVISAGAQATGRVLKSQRAGMFGRSGDLQLAIETVKAVDGSDVKLRGTPDGQGGNQAVLAIGAALLLTVFAVFIQGRNAVLPADKEILAYVAENKDFAVMAPPLQTASQPLTAPVQPPTWAPAPQAATWAPAPQAPVTAVTGPQVMAVQTQPQIVAVQTQPQIVAVQTQPQVQSVQPAAAGAIGASEQQPAGPAPTVLRKLMLCKSVNAAGWPDRDRDTVSAGFPSLSLWWEVAPTEGDRKFEVRWLHEKDGVFATTSKLVQAGKATGWVTVLPPTPQRFALGLWRAELYVDGQLVKTREFQMTF